MKELDFSEYWVEVEKLSVLPDMAIKQLPNSLSEDIKKKLMEMTPQETVELLKNVIDQINRGSVETIDCLVRTLL